MSIEEHTIQVIGQFVERLPAEFIDDCRSLARHNEWGLAIENLCTQLYECDVRPSALELDEIRRLAESAGLKEDTWNFLVSSGAST
jgi:hypothetical protein